MTLPTTDRPDPVGPAPVVSAGEFRPGWGSIPGFFSRHPRVMDGIVIACYVLTSSLVVLPLTAMSEPLAQTITFLVLSVGAGVALWWRRTAPLTTLLIVTAITVFLTFVYIDSGTSNGVAFALYAVTSLRGARTGVIWFAAVASAMVIAALVARLFTELDAEIATVTLVLNLFNATVPTALATAIGASVFNRRKYVASLRETAERLELEHEQREELAVAGERVRIARELHDITAHSLTVMVTLAEAAARSQDPDRAREVMSEVAITGRHALTDTRRVVGALRREADDIDPSAPLEATPSVHELAARFRTAGLAVEVVQEGELPTDAPLRLAVFRVIQESLTNVLRYAASSTSITVTILTQPHEVRLRVVNDAPAVAQPPVVAGAGRGISGMRERVAVFGGTLEAGRTARGWQVVAVFPMNTKGAGL